MPNLYAIDVVKRATLRRNAPSQRQGRGKGFLFPFLPPELPICLLKEMKSTEGLVADP